MESARQRVVWPPGMKNVVRRDVAYLRAALSPSMNVTSAFNAWYATCRIFGARLKVTGSVAPPDTFLLSLDLEGFEVDCKVAWRKNKEIGVLFTSPLRMVPPKRAQSVKPLPLPTPSVRRK
jgi:hypothetical protein